MKNFDIIDEINSTIFGSLQKSIQTGSSKSIYEFVKFFRSVIRNSVRENQIEVFKRYIGFPSKIYQGIAFSQRNSTFLNELMTNIVDQLGLHLREIIIYYITLQGRRVKSDEERVIINEFYYQAFFSFNQFFYMITRKHDWELLTRSLRYFSHLAEGAFEADTSLKLRLHQLSNTNENGRYDQAIAQIQRSISISDEYSKFRRHITVGLKYWLLCLFDNALIDEHNLKQILNQLDGISNDNTEEDIVFFYTGDLRTYMGWEDWDYIDRPEHEAYSPPMASDWMVFGFLIDRIRTNNSYFNIDAINNSSRSDIPFLYDAIEKGIDVLRGNYNKWVGILRTTSIQEFDRRGGGLLAAIARAKRTFVAVKELEIANSNISEDRVQEFTGMVADAWRKQVRIRKLFDYFLNKKDVTGQDIKLKRVGTNTFFEKAKIQFIDGIYHSHIYGIEGLGGSVGRWEDDLFFEVVFSSDYQTCENLSVEITLQQCIDLMRSNKKEPSVIILEPEYAYKDESFVNSPKFSRTTTDLTSFQNISSYIIGFFDGIPLFTSFSKKLKNKLVVAEFASAFEMLYKINDKWIDLLLSITVDKVSDELAKVKFEQNPDKWRMTDNGQTLSVEEALTLVKTSIVIDIETLLDFKIINLESFVVGHVSDPPTT
jgi:hypothetical protein